MDRLNPAVQERRIKIADARSRIERAIDETLAQEGLTQAELMFVLGEITYSRAGWPVAAEHGQLGAPKDGGDP